MTEEQTGRKKALTIRFYTNDYRALVDAAKREGIPLAEYIRRGAFERELRQENEAKK